MTLFERSVPPSSIPPPITIHTLSRIGLGVDAAAGMFGVVAEPASRTWASANQAIFIPITIDQDCIALQLFSVNGGAVSGSRDIGIYSVTGTRMVSTGSVAQAGTDVIQAHAVAATPLAAGQYYLALAHSDAVGNYAAVPATIRFAQAAGCAVQASAFPLPVQATLAAFATATFIPIIGLSLRTTPAP